MHPLGVLERDAASWLDLSVMPPARNESAATSRLATLRETFELCEDAVLVAELVAAEPGVRALLVNPAFTRLTGWTLGDLQTGLGQTVAAGPAAQELVAHLDRGVHEAKPSRSDVSLRRKSGPPIRCSVSVTPVRDLSGELTRVLVIARDIAAEVAREQGLRRTLAENQRRLDTLAVSVREGERRARVDAVTGLANRCHVLERLVGELERCRRERVPLGFALLRLQIDAQGGDDTSAGSHAVGTARPSARPGSSPGARRALPPGVFSEAARRLACSVRVYDVPARWNDDTLAVMVAGVDDEAGLMGLVERIRTALRAEPAVGGSGTPAVPRISIGITGTFGEWPTSAGDVVGGAERALIASLRDGGGSIRFARPIG